MFFHWSRQFNIARMLIEARRIAGSSDLTTSAPIAVPTQSSPLMIRLWRHFGGKQKPPIHRVKVKNGISQGWLGATKDKTGWPSAINSPTEPPHAQALFSHVFMPPLFHLAWTICPKLSPALASSWTYHRASGPTKRRSRQEEQQSPRIYCCFSTHTSVLQILRH